MSSQNGILFQYFSWALPDNGQLWNWLKDSADHLRSIGVTAVWIPPAYKSHDDGPINRVGYGVYDHFDLGEFQQKSGQNSEGSLVRTKYGTKRELHNAIHALHGFGYSDGQPRSYIQVYADIVMNHKLGADASEDVRVFHIGTVGQGDLYGEWKKKKDDPAAKEIKSIQTIFNFPGRLNTVAGSGYSDFTWNSTHFDAVVDGNEQIYMIDGHYLDWKVALEQGFTNYDILLGADLDFENLDVREEMKRWGVWLIEQMGFDGFRIDANKHISFTFIREWIGQVKHDRRQSQNKELFSFSEYMNGNRNELEK
jgi:alpha-amylase